MSLACIMIYIFKLSFGSKNLHKVYWQTLKMWFLFCLLLKKFKVINTHLDVDFPVSRMHVNWLYVAHADHPCQTMVFLLTSAKPVVEIFSKRT